MKIWLFFAAAAAGYLLGSVNPAIILSKIIYRADVRRFGSHNPGFTNFKRVFGDQHAYTVFFFDFAKAAILCGVFGALFRNAFGLYHTGAAFVTIFTLLGHAYPIWYDFRGGKGVAVMFGSIWFIDWRAAVAVFVLFLILMACTRYMSLSVIIASCAGPIAMLMGGYETLAELLMVIACVAFMILRHRENILRLKNGTESRFSLKSKK